MRHRRALVILAAALLVGALALIASCGGGGGGGGYGVVNPPAPGKELDSGTIGAGTAFAHRFATAGTFPYHCAIHAVMRGVNVVVSATAPAADTVAAISIIGMTAPYFSPTTVTIHTGGKVTWTNNDAVGHTVTSD